MNNKIYNRILLCGLLSSPFIVFGMEKNETIITQINPNIIPLIQIPNDSQPNSRDRSPMHRHKMHKLYANDLHSKILSTGATPPLRPSPYDRADEKHPLINSRDLLAKLKTIEETTNKANNLKPTTETNDARAQEAKIIPTSTTIDFTKRKRQMIGDLSAPLLSEETMIQLLNDTTTAMLK